MRIPWVETPAHVRELFHATTDVVVVDVYDILVFNDEGEEQDPVDGCRIFVRTRRIAQKICEMTGWHPDEIPNLDLGYRPAATFTLIREASEAQYRLESFLDKEKIYRRGRWINTYQPPES
ncbi:MAG: hypothetical protein Q8Q94_02690 [bacterium]|nr:hypothetical protein [bacterium]